MTALWRTFPSPDITTVVLSGFPEGLLVEHMDDFGNDLQITGGPNGLRLSFAGADNIVTLLDRIATLKVADPSSVVDFDLQIEVFSAEGASEALSLPVVGATRAPPSPPVPPPAPLAFDQESLQPTFLRASLAAASTIELEQLGEDLVQALLRSFPPNDLESVTLSGFLMGMVVSYMDENGNMLTIAEGMDGVKLQFRGDSLIDLYDKIETVSVVSSPVSEDFSLTVEARTRDGQTQLFVLPIIAPVRQISTERPTSAPSESPIVRQPPPTGSPQQPPTRRPTSEPSFPLASDVTEPPTTPGPTAQPTPQPTSTPSRSPVRAPTTSSPTKSPTVPPTPNPTRPPTNGPTARPTLRPTPRPTPSPTDAPTERPTPRPTPRPTQAPTPRPTTNPTAAPDSTFDMTFNFHDLGSVKEAAVRSAAERWESIIVADLMDMDGSMLEPIFDFAIGSCNYPDVIDDLHSTYRSNGQPCCLSHLTFVSLLLAVCVGVFHDSFDGPSGFLGFGGTEYIRPNGLPFTGIIFFDPDDADMLSSVIIQHEMAHSK